jgi:hypothetical protein
VRTFGCITLYMFIQPSKKTAVFVIALLAFINAHSQNVGIGTTNPAGRLHIDLNGTTTPYAILIDDDGDAVIRIRKGGVSKGFLQVAGNNIELGSYATNPFGKLIFQTNSNDRMVISAAGNIGVGISDPIGQFQIATGADASATTHGYLMLGNTTGNNIVFDNDEILARNNGVVSTLFLGREGGKIHLGDGPEAAGTKLHISNGTDAGLPNNQSGFLMMGSQTGLNIVADNNEIQARNNGTAAHLYLQNSGGNVALGNITPVTQLHMTGHLTMQNVSSTIQFKNDAATNVGFIQGYTDNLQLGTNVGNNTGSVLLRTNGVNRLAINHLGWVGIGTSSPDADFHIEGSVHPQVMVINTVGGRSIDFRRDNIPSSYIKFSFDDIKLGTYDANNYGRFILETQEEERLTIHPNGRIGINTNYENYPYRLAVNGEIICTDITTAPFANWPDYVFSEDYKLTPLNEVEKFIQANHHLSNIPSAKEIEQKGIQLGDMQKKMMEKIEELTLYIIALDKKNDALNNEMKEFRKKSKNR